jgi:hypothetical protein
MLQRAVAEEATMGSQEDRYVELVLDQHEEVWSKANSGYVVETVHQEFNDDSAMRSPAPDAESARGSVEAQLG